MVLSYPYLTQRNTIRIPASIAHVQVRTFMQEPRRHIGVVIVVKVKPAVIREHQHFHELQVVHSILDKLLHQVPIRTIVPLQLFQ